MHTKLLATLIALAIICSCFSQNYPEGFNEEVAFDQFESPAGILHTNTDISVVWELSGKVWVITGDEISETPVIDISEEVAFWGDLGMIGAVLHPDFLNNGYIYLLYSVDRHHLLNYGTEDYDPNVSETGVPSIGRLTRYQLNTIDFQFTIPDSRSVLMGANKDDGLPICAPSHGTGALLFGEDGSLLVSTGDGNTWVRSTPTQGYNGQGPLPNYAYDSLALSDGILHPLEFLGGFRSQFLDGLNGKILRLDPETGYGLPNNPFYDPETPDSPRSKTWSLGLRNPYRMTIKPGTGFGSPDDGFPGVIYIADVGDWVFEEINAVIEPGLNFGWPMFQGPDQHDLYYYVPTQNSNAPNPLYGNQNCNNEFFDYQDIIMQPNETHNYYFQNPCNENQEVPEDVITFEHERPILAYANTANDDYPYAVVPIWDENGESSFLPIEDPESGVQGTSFDGISGSGGVFLNSDSIPEEYKGLYIQGDFSGWLRAFRFNETHELQSVELWNDFVGAPIHITENPSDGCIYVTSIYPPEIKRICFGGNLKPIISVTPKVVFGIGVLDVVFDASQSYDPEGEDLDFAWDFGDGTTGTGAILEHTFTPNDSGIEISEVLLTVTDPEGASASQIIPVSLNNTPPNVKIVSIKDGELYSSQSPTQFNLLAEGNDLESSDQALIYKWNLILNHNTHFHYLDEFEGNNLTNQIFPTGCDEEESYWYEFVVTATDPGGLSATDSVEIYPDCEGVLTSNQSNEPFILFPNPVIDTKINVFANIDLGDEVSYGIYSNTGSFIYGSSVAIFNERKYFYIEIPEIAAGAYTVRFNAKGSSYSVRFFKSKF